MKPRPTFYKKIYARKVKEWLDKGGTIKDFALKINVGRNTVYLWRKKIPEFGLACEKHRLKYDP